MPERLYQLSEYENSFRRPSNNSCKNVVADVAGQSSSKMAILREASKRAHLNQRAQWQPPAATSAATSTTTTPPRRRSSTPPPAIPTQPRTRSTTPPREATPQRTPPRTRPKAGRSEEEVMKDVLFQQLTNLNKDRSPRGSSTATPFTDSLYPGSPESSEVSGPSSLRQRTDASPASSSQPRRHCVNTPPSRPSPRGISDANAAEELCRRWASWSQEISSAVEKGASLPPPPVPQPDVPGVTSLLLRFLEASAFAAAALARGTMEAKDLRAEVGKHRDKHEENKDSIRELRSRVKELEALSEAKDAKVAEAQRRLQAPCSECREAQLRLSDLGDEVERLRGALQDLEARRQKEVEDALSLADDAEAKHAHLMTVLRQVLASNGGPQGANADVVADLAMAAVSRGAHMDKAAAPSSRSGQGETCPVSACGAGGRDELVTTLRLDPGERESIRKRRDGAEVSSRPSAAAASSVSESKSWWRAPAELRAVGVQAESEADEAPEFSEEDSPEPSPAKTRSGQVRSKLSGDSPALRDATWAHQHSTARAPASGASREERRKSEPVVATGTKGAESRIRSADALGSGLAASSAPGDLADATQRLELEVVELCRALSGSSPRGAQLDSTRTDFQDDESVASPPPRTRSVKR